MQLLGLAIVEKPHAKMRQVQFFILQSLRLN